MNIGFVGNITPPVGGAEVFLHRFLTCFLRNRRRSGTLVRWRKQIFRYFPERVVRVYAKRGTVKHSNRLDIHYLFEALERKKYERRSLFQERTLAHAARQGLEAAQIFRRRGANLIHAHMLYPNLIFASRAAQALRVPLVLTIHGMLEFRILESVRAKYKKLAGCVDEFIAKADLVIAVSDEIARACRARGAKRVEKLSCGIDTEFFSARCEAKSKSQDLLFLGTVRKDKGALLLMQAFEQIMDSIEGNLVFIGRRLIKGAAFEKARRNRRIQFLGEETPLRVRKALKQAKMVVLPSVNEGLPLSILEAMACRKPVLVTNTGELSHLIQHGRNGFLINKRTPTVLGSQIKQVLAHPGLHEIGKKARRTALAFDIRTVVERYETFYRSLLPKRIFSEDPSAS